MKDSDGKSIRVLLVDDHRSVLWGLQRLIDSEQPAMEAVGSATNCAEALALLDQARPDVIILDIDLGSESGLDAIPVLVERSRARILVLTGMRDTLLHEKAVLAGARGVVAKEDPAGTILKAIRKVHEGELWVDRVTTGRILIELARRNTREAGQVGRSAEESLTARERQIIATLAQNAGKTAKAIAALLNISEHTLRNHLTSIYEKLGVANRLELFAYAQKKGLDKA